MSNIERYADLQADFYHYMVKYGGIAKKTSGDYVTRMKFLATTIFWTKRSHKRR